MEEAIDGATGRPRRSLHSMLGRLDAWGASQIRSVGSRRLGKEPGSTDVAGVARGLISGRVGTLLVEAGREIPGSLDRMNGAVEFADLALPRVDDLLDDIAAVAFQMGGDVVVVPRDRMPVDSGLAAIDRF